jgi:hypothetical protein
MLKRKVFQSRWVAFALAIAFGLLILPGEGFGQKTGGMLTGFIFGEDMKTPSEGAIVKLRNIKDGTTYQSLPADKTGLYSLKNVAAGRYLIGISGSNGDYNFDYEIQILSNEIAKLALALKPGGIRTAASTDQEKEKKAFFLTPFGSAVIVASAALLSLGGVSLLNSPQSISPSKK